MGGEKAYYPRFGLLQIKKVQGSSFSRQNLVNHNNDPQIQRVLEIYKKKRKNRGKKEKEKCENEEKHGGEVVYRNYIEKYLPTSELIVFNKHSVQDDWRTYTYIYTEVTVSVFVPSKSRPLYLCQPETLLSHARRITRVSHARAFTTTLDADRRNIRSYPIKMSCLRRTYVGTFVLSRNGIIVPQARDTSITPNAPFRGCLARNPPLCATLSTPSILHPWCSAVVRCI